MGSYNMEFFMSGLFHFWAIDLIISISQVDELRQMESKQSSHT